MKKDDYNQELPKYLRKWQEDDEYAELIRWVYDQMKKTLIELRKESREKK